MQLDMHYYATYAMARAAGVEPGHARIIATSAQFVDDNVARSHVDFRDGSRIDQEATAHHPIDLLNRDDRDQRGSGCRSTSFQAMWETATPNGSSAAWTARSYANCGTII